MSDTVSVYIKAELVAAYHAKRQRLVPHLRLHP